MKTIKYIAGAVIAILLIITAIVLFNTINSKPAYVEVESAEDISIDHAAASNRFAKALTFKTIANKDPLKFPGSEYDGFHRFLVDSFPLVHSRLKKEVVGGYSLLYTWQGSDNTKKPILFMAHQDVVPIAPGTLDKWIHPPFGGKVSDGYIWGRGAIDNKSGVMGILEAVENLLVDGFAPKQTIYLSFGHDEEIGGNDGAKKTVELLQKRGVELEYVLDEGGIITDKMFPGISDPVAIIGIAEKGYISLELVVEGKGGHSSMPPKETTVGILSKAITKLENDPFKPRIDGAAGLMFEKLAPYMPFYERMGLSNLWLFECFALNRITQSQSANAMVRTTTAPTMLEGSNKENVLAAKAKAVVNFRVLPGDTTDTVIKRVTKVVNDKRVIVSPGTLQINPSPVSD
ncbi:MAG: M20/M25/M40 family metallo-hydrolase, partial [Candidatus Dadabacteria bacterium]|nr:M20/M25/M40 family metallo-hydrolase [Candidatus Dadabacteria bacterium]NIX15017.1 M20/M25/M40 family metallo-hydrolase [Candidatus Dadabacteria bacterium]